MKTIPRNFIIACGIIYIAYALPGCTPGPKKEKTTEQNPAWEKTGPGGGGATFIPSFSYYSPDHFLVRCDMTGSYLTADGGGSYRQINFPNGASAYAYDPKDSNTIYIGASFLNRSTDGGKTWEKIYPAPGDIISETYYGDHANYHVETKDSSVGSGIDVIRPDPAIAGALYFCIGPVFYYSSDNGKTWKNKKLEENISYLYTNKTSAKDEVYIFTPSSVQVFSKLSGELKRHDLPKEISPAFSFTAGTVAGSDKMLVYAIHHDPSQEIRGEFGYSEVWISADQGATWKKAMDPIITNQQSGIKPSYSMIACAEADAGKAYIVTNRYVEKKNAGSTAYWYGSLKTADGGKSWNWVWKGGGGSGTYGIKDGQDAANLEDAWAHKAFGGEYIRLMDVGVYPRNGDVAIVTDWYRTMKTMDGGKTWKQVYSIPQSDGSYTSNGMDVTTTYGVHFDPFDSAHIAISYTDIGYHHSYNGGKSWSRSAAGVPVDWINTCYWLVFDPEVKDKIWSVWSGMHDFPRGKMTRNPNWKQTGKGGVCVSADGGKTWTPSNSGMDMNSPATCIVLDPRSPKNNRTLYASVYNKGVFKSTDDGKTWVLKNKGIGENTCAFELTLTGNGVLFLTVSPTPAYKNGKKGREYYSGAVYRSADGAETWTKLAIGNGPVFPNGIDYDRKDPNRIYLACWAGIDLSDLLGGDVARSTGGNEKINMKGGIFLSEDGGNTWKQIFDDKQYVYDVTVDPYHPGRLYCNTFNSAAYRSDDYGKTWKKIKGYDFHWGHRIIVDENDHDKIYLTTFGSSVWHGIPETE